MISSDAFPLMSNFNETPAFINSRKFYPQDDFIIGSTPQTRDVTNSSLNDIAFTGTGRNMNTTEGLEGHQIVLVLLLPPIIITGSFGNAMAVAVLLRPRMRYTSVYFYLLVLACTDTVLLYVSAAKTWLRIVTGGFELMHLSSTLCKLVMYIMLVSQCLSAWLVVLMTIDRFLAVWFPFKAAVLTSLTRARFATLVLTVIILIVNCHVLWTFGLQSHKPSDDLPVRFSCTFIYPHYYNSLTGPFEYFKLTAYSSLPFVIILSLNIAIIVRLRSRTTATMGPDPRRGLVARISEPPSLNENVARLAGNRYKDGRCEVRRNCHDNNECSHIIGRPQRIGRGYDELSTNRWLGKCSERDDRFLAVENGNRKESRKVSSGGNNSSRTSCTENSFSDISICKTLLKAKHRKRATSDVIITGCYDDGKAGDVIPNLCSATGGRYSIALDRSDSSRFSQSIRKCVYCGEVEMDGASTVGILGGNAGGVGVGGIGGSGMGAVTPESWQTRLTFMLLVVSFSWLVLTAPWTLYGIALHQIPKMHQYHIMVYVRMACFLLMYTNHAVNFYLYCITGRKFRSELLGLFGCSGPRTRTAPIDGCCCLQPSRRRRGKPREPRDRHSARDRTRFGLAQPSASPSSTASLRGLPTRSTNIIELDMMEY